MCAASRGNLVFLKGAWDSETHFHFSETGERRERGLDTRREVKPLHPSQAGQPSLSLSFSLPVCPSRPSQGLHGATKENEHSVLGCSPLSTGKPDSANQFNLRRLLVLKTNFMFNFLSKGQDTQYVFIFLCSTIKQMLVRTKKISWASWQGHHEILLFLAKQSHFLRVGN